MIIKEREDVEDENIEKNDKGGQRMRISKKRWIKKRYDKIIKKTN